MVGFFMLTAIQFAPKKITKGVKCKNTDFKYFSVGPLSSE